MQHCGARIAPPILQPLFAAYLIDWSIFLKQRRPWDCACGGERRQSGNAVRNDLGAPQISWLARRPRQHRKTSPKV